MKRNFQVFCVIFNLFLISGICLFTTTEVMSQSYNTACGIRIGSDFGISAVQRIAKRNTLELIYEDGLFESNRNIDLLIKRHLPLITKSFNFYTGIGLGYTSGESQDPNIREGSFSIPMILGAEITLGHFNIATDFQPTLLMRKIDDQRIVRSSGVSIRYVLVKRKNKKVNNFFDGLFKKSQSKSKSKKK